MKQSLQTAFSCSSFLLSYPELGWGEAKGNLVIWVEGEGKYKYFSHNEKVGHEHLYSCPALYLCF
ncbi:hypothetical protein COJ07_17770 [Bacillus cereus]|nr:hypothetical protein COJ07_17770 [Bacillus cereus]